MILPSAFSLSSALALGAAAAYIWPAVRAHHISTRQVRFWITVAWLLHGALLGLGLLGSQAFFGFAPALSMAAWIAVAIYAVESHIYPQLQTRLALYTLGAGAVVLAWIFPGKPMPATTSIWLTLHLACGVASYGLIASAVIHAWLMGRAEQHIRRAQDPHSGVPLLTLERLTYRFAQAGFVLLSATLAGGIVFSEALYGHAVHWNHKTIFAVLAWLILAGLLTARHLWGWRGKYATRTLYAGAGFLLLAYAGSRFVLEILLQRTP